MKILNQVVFDDLFEVESQTAETFKPFGNITNMIELIAPPILGNTAETVLAI